MSKGLASVAAVDVDKKDVNGNVDIAVEAPDVKVGPLFCVLLLYRLNYKIRFIHI